jgi:hypothetical protein
VKNLFILRCHRFGEAENDLLNFVAPYFGKENMVVVADERKEGVHADNWTKYSLNDGQIHELKLLNPRNCGWLCGDYFLYIAHNARPEYDYYWMFEPDVYLSFGAAEDFFSRLESVSCDLVTPHFGKKERWFWTQRAKIIAEDVYGCRFSVIRLSKKAIGHLQKERAELTRKFENQGINSSEWPNDESFVCTTLMRDGFLCKSLNSINAFSGPDFGITPILTDVVINKAPLNRALHPVLRGAAYQRKVRSEFNVTFSSQIKKHFSERVLPNTTGEHVFDIVIDVIDVLFEDLKQVLPASLQNSWLDGIRKTELLLQNAKDLKYFAIKRYSIKEKSRKQFAVANHKDFVLVDGKALDILKKDRYSPYSFDCAEKKFYLTESDKDIGEKPFFYQAQFESAQSVVTLPLAMAEEVYGAYNRRLNPTFLFSIGRCGSTLLSKLTRSLGMVDVSEPDIFTAFGPNKRYVTQLEFDKILFYTVRMLEDFFGVPSAQMVIKPRSGCSSSCKEIYRNFPNAKYIFITRELSSWSKSYIRAFNWSSEQLFQTLTVGIDALCFFKEKGIKLFHLTYEDMVEDPRVVLREIAGRDDLSAWHEEQITRIVSRHSQSGTGLESARRIPSQDVEKRSQDFLELWDRSKPRDKLEFLGISL